MRSAVKAAVVLLVTLPMLAYVAGRLVAAPPDLGPRAPVILDDPVPSSSSRTPSPPSTPTSRPDPDDPDHDDQDDGVRVVNPTPTRVGEDDGAADPEGDDHPDDDDTDDGNDGDD